MGVAMNLFDPTGWLVQSFILGTGVIGQVYVARMNVCGFYFWLAGNVALVAVSWHLGSFGMFGLYLYFSVMAVYSILHWKKRQIEEQLRNKHHADLIQLVKFFVQDAENEVTSPATVKCKHFDSEVLRAKVLLREIAA